VVWAILAVVPGGIVLGIVAYIVAWIIMPRQPSLSTAPAATVA
jgi:phage shock protein PspC (stress-responsive transcriptional regulator)